MKHPHSHKIFAFLTIAGTIGGILISYITHAQETTPPPETPTEEPLQPAAETTQTETEEILPSTPTEITLPSPTLPELIAPTAETPLPETTIPTLTLPSPTLTETITPEEQQPPAITLPTITTLLPAAGEITLPESTLPEITLPESTLPEITLPSATLPEEKPRIDLDPLESQVTETYSAIDIPFLQEKKIIENRFAEESIKQKIQQKSLNYLEFSEETP